VQSGTWGFRLELEATGLDATAEMTLLARFTLDGETESQDAAATVTFQCEGQGPAWTSLVVPLDADDQTPDAVAALDGVSFELTASVVDAADTSATAAGTYVFAAP
jgi:hypothetical protein